MENLDQVLTEIARMHLRIPTLETRRSDRLDFHDVAVWQVRTALKAAFDAGQMAGSLPPRQAAGGPTRFDDYEIQPCRRYINADEAERSFVEPSEPPEADFWTLYGHIPGEGVHAIGDFDTRKHAEEVFARITGRHFSDAGNPVPGHPAATR